MAYTLFSYAPPLTYTSTLRLYFILQSFLFVFVIYQLTRFAAGTRFQSILTALTLTLVFQPLKTEFTVGNMNTIVMFTLLIALSLANVLEIYGLRRTQHSLRISILLATLLLVLMGTVSMLKPTVALMGITMVLFLLVRFDLAKIWPAIPISAIILAGIAYLPSLRLGSPTIWLDWREYFEHGNLDMFALPITKGNFSTALFLSNSLGMPLSTITLCTAAILIFSLTWAANRSGNTRKALQNSFSDPLMSLSIGLAIFYAISPLVWFHYFLLILIPGIAFFNPRYNSTHVSKFMIACVLLASSLLLQIAWFARTILPFEAMHQPEFISNWVMAIWIPLWLGLLNVVRGYGREINGPAVTQEFP